MNTDQPVAKGDASWQQDLSKLLEWMEAQKGGVATFYEFQRRTLQLRAGNRDHAALLRLLADMAGRFADAFDGEPLEVSIASQALDRLTGHVRRAVGLVPDRMQAHLDLLNEVASMELAPDDR
jgi:hypothetical protein